MKKLLILFSAFFISVTMITAQSISIGATGGLTTVTGPDQLTNDIEEGGLGFGTHPHFGVKAKFGLPVIPLTITGQVIYTSFSGEGEFTSVGGTTANIETESSLLTYGLGAEYNFVPGPISPYLALDVFMANFGDTEVKSTSVGGSLEQSFEGETRTGIGIGAGLDFGLLPMLDIDLSAKYNINNLIGKDDGEETISTINISATVFLGL